MMFEEPVGTTDTRIRRESTATDDRDSESGRSSFAERYVEADTHEA
jgi:hypothetical protein